MEAGGEGDIVTTCPFDYSYSSSFMPISNDEQYSTWLEMFGTDA
jgi:hypothetical protein